MLNLPGSNRPEGNRQLAARTLRRVTEPDQLRDQHITLVALDLDHAIPDGPAAAATLLELLGEFLELSLGQGQTGDDRDALAASA